MAYSKRTFMLIGLGVALVGGLAFVSFREDPIPVDIAQVTRGPFEITINADGKTQVKDLFEVASPIAGTALRSPVDVGDPVRKGETVVAVVQPSSSGLLDARSRLQAEAALQEALAARHVAVADLRQAEETRSFAQSQFERTQQLVERNVASITRLEDDTQRLATAIATVEAAQARIEMADGAIERARASLLDPEETEQAEETCCIELTAPADGVILSIAAISERPVSIGAPLVSIGDPNDLELVADILSNDAVRLKPDALAYVDRWGGPATLLAQLDRIDPKARTKVSALGIEEQRVDAYFRLTSPPQERANLGDEFSVFLRIVEYRAEDVMQIPLSAVFRSGDDWAVFVEIDGVAERRLVQLGRRNGQMTEVHSGLEFGEHVVTHPSDAIATGATLVQRSKL
ncbi:HlyD family efflux transporter periplasmic adaptor subunit [Sulfitobacter sp. JBTF-M27]|uniref:HlyD family efflux transporter periplasmic adaptor subunit n=1 Tax=Sulfitobacter sediminilitoris TaxID=2698830 RepID=A0A6P0CHI9_9RHOB|nr:HlyD family efflux transporter periplasmic adaptor subunit [Sulfitobacter sediminilitoris]NEK24768.1 HlyD family efflux transporter periplasmic adaptor subunit [Sulfitobacter sediminilitoris]